LYAILLAIAINNYLVTKRQRTYFSGGVMIMPSSFCPFSALTLRDGIFKLEHSRGEIPVSPLLFAIIGVVVIARPSLFN